MFNPFLFHMFILNMVLLYRSGNRLTPSSSVCSTPHLASPPFLPSLIFLSFNNNILRPVDPFTFID